MDQNTPACSHDTSTDQEIHHESTKEDSLENSANLKVSSVTETSKSIILASTSSQKRNEYQDSVQGSVPLIIRPSYQSPIMCQLRSHLHLHMTNQPPSLFLQALSRLNESSPSLAALSPLKSTMTSQRDKNQNGLDSSDITPPDSLTSAPPSYSFVLQQMAARRRPRLMGTFIPSPSFVPHTPPPTYATAFDIYVDNRIPPSQPPRVYNFGFTSMMVICPECGFTGTTVVICKITLCTHLCALLLCLFCCWLCAPLPYILRSCKDVYHYCRNCRSFLGMYCPTNPEGTFP